MNNKKKLFVIVRRDLTPSQQAVQGGHVVAEYLFMHPGTEWENGTLVYLGVKNEEGLMKWAWKLALENIPWTCFTEPDINNEWTAIASFYNESFFRNLQVL